MASETRNAKRQRVAKDPGVLDTGTAVYSSGIEPRRFKFGRSRIYVVFKEGNPYMDPKEARRLAAWLRKAATYVERKFK